MADDVQDRASSEAGDASEGSADVIIGGRYRLVASSPLPDLDLGDAKAYVAQDSRNEGEQLFMRICPPTAMPRMGIFNNLRHMMEASLLRPLEYGSVKRPGIDGNCTAIVFKRPDHGALMPAGETTIPAMQPDEISRCVLGPAVLTLGYMAQRGLTHRAIRPDNMYWDGTLKTSVMLGDCVSFAPAALQPVVYESVESAMTPPIARGVGTIRDDFYALGVTALVLSSGSVPLNTLSPDDVIRAKLQRGSFSAMMEGERPPFGLRELLRGLLSDDSYNRWGLEQLEQWLGGGLRSSVQEVRTGAVERPFAYDGKEFSNYRLLADAFGRDDKKAAKALADPGFDKWLRRGVNDNAMADRIQAVLDVSQDSKTKGKPGPRHVTQVCMLLDPFGPIRYKGLVSMPNGNGSALADAFNRSETERIQVIAECLSTGVALDWYELKGTTESIIYDQEIKQIKKMQQMLRHTAPGYGIERCLYLLDPSYPCRSDIVKGIVVNGIRDLLPALEQIVERHGELKNIVDRHITAFVASRIKSNIDKPLAALEAAQGDATATKLAMLSILARIQSTSGPTELPFLTAWMARELESTVNRINSKSLREKMRKRVRTLAGTGSLVDLHSCLNSEKAFNQDKRTRKAAMRSFAEAAREIAQLESREFQESAQRLGWKIASGISTSIAFITVCFVALS